MSLTIPWNALSPENQSHIIKHNSYGLDHLNAIHEAHPVEFILSASQSHKTNMGVHFQNVTTTWVQFKQMLSTALSSSLFGSPLHSHPICGTTKLKELDFNQEKVCLKWYQASLTLPLLRISSDEPLRDPISLTSKTLAKIAGIAIKERYKLLPFYYSVLLERLPMMRPMMFDFFADNNTLVLDEQYMVGKEILVAHPTYPNAAKLNVYLPKVSGGWYEYWGGSKYETSGWNALSIVEMDFVMFLRAGSIIPVYSVSIYHFLT